MLILPNMFCIRVIMLLILYTQKAAFSRLPRYQHLHGGPSLNFDVSIIFCSTAITHWWYISIFPLFVIRPHPFYSTTTTTNEHCVVNRKSILGSFLTRQWQKISGDLKRGILWNICDAFVTKMQKCKIYQWCMVLCKKMIRHQNVLEKKISKNKKWWSSHERVNVTDIQWWTKRF